MWPWGDNKKQTKKPAHHTALAYRAEPKSRSLHPTGGNPSFWPGKLQLSAQTHRGVVFAQQPSRVLKQPRGLQPSIKQKRKGLYPASTAKSKITHKS